MAMTIKTSCEALNGPAKATHVNMMTDTIIANLPPDGLRSVLRALLGVDANVTPAFHRLTADYLGNTSPDSTPQFFSNSDATPALFQYQRRYRCLIGCGYGFEGLEALSEVLIQTQNIVIDEAAVEETSLMDTLAIIDSDLVQALTAVQTKLLTSAGLRKMSESELHTVRKVKSILTGCKKHAETTSGTFAFERGMSRLAKLDGGAKNSGTLTQSFPSRSFTTKPTTLETTLLGSSVVPRMFMGLWQFSSPAWGSASRSKIDYHFRKHVDAGFIAYDMADHYGDAEVTFGQFRSSQPDAHQIFCATKWAIFESVTITKEMVEANISERLHNINAGRIELLQLHWQDYNNHQYIKAAKLIEEDPRVEYVGLCNFDTIRMNEIIQSGIKVVSNQVQFSLIDLRPTFKMMESCRKYKVKLLTYGSLCGGLLADRWLDKPAPTLFDEEMTPSTRKYFEMIMVWGGWQLFQVLLRTLAFIGRKYNVSISVVAIRWVLDHDYVGSVIIGARMGISEHTEENLKVFSFKLDEEDQALIQKVLGRCRAREVAEAMGDCGAEYRQ